MRPGRIRKWVVRPILVGVVLVGGFVVARYQGGNVGVIASGSARRSGQLSARQLDALARDAGIRTVLNLRGSNPDQPWYRVERAVTLGRGATQIDFAMASDHWLSREQARALIRILDTCERPLLIHCEWGAERTGLVASWATLLDPGGDLRTARAQFSPYYLYLPTREGRIMSGHLERYADWLDRAGLAHAPERFRAWVESVYRPGSPSREEWPYDPYPLVVITRSESVGAGIARESVDRIARH